MGYLDEHSSLVANVRHLKTGFVSPQYHVVFDDLFESVFSSGPNDAVVDAICEDLYKTSRDIYATDEYDAHDNLVYKPPPLDEVWLDAEGREQRQSIESVPNSDIMVRFNVYIYIYFMKLIDILCITFLNPFLFCIHLCPK